MFWEEDEDKSLPYSVPDEIIDLSFSIKSKSIPINHAWLLSREIIKHLPWIENHDTAAIHQIHVAESNNGWLRPENEDALLHPSRRTKLTLRIPINKLEETQALTGKVLHINKSEIKIGSSKKKLFTNSSVIFSRYILDLENNNEDENVFLSKMADEIFSITNFKVKKMLCGKSHTIKTPDGHLQTRHLMIADLDSESSIKIQQRGLGDGKELGCGIFLPHKGIKSLNSSD